MPPCCALTGTRRTRSPSPLSSGGTGIIKPNVNCVIVPARRASARLGSARLASVARETAAIERSAVHQPRAFHFFSFSPRAVAVPHDVIVPSADPLRSRTHPESSVQLGEHLVSVTCLFCEMPAIILPQTRATTPLSVVSSLA